MDLPATNVDRTKLPSVAIHLFQAGAIITNMISFVFNFLSSHFIITITTMFDITITTIRIPRKECDMQYTITTMISFLFKFSSSPPTSPSPPSSSSPPSSPPYHHHHHHHNHPFRIPRKECDVQYTQSSSLCYKTTQYGELMLMLIMVS